MSAVCNGVKPLWASEIDEYPAAVSHYHFPDVKQYGDVTKINGAEVAPVDILCAGSPCQDLSVAGKRNGLDGERSGLFHEAIRIMREMREKTNGEYPKYFVWENVPGAFSSNRGQDFRVVLEEITASEIPMPNSGKWAEAGMVRSDKCRVEWRVLDAQYWGVPQRRKRIFLVADFTNGNSGEILFERKSVCGDSAESERTGQETSKNAGRSSDGTGTTDKLITCYNMGQPSNNFEPYTEGGGVSPTLISRMGTGGNQIPIVHSVFENRHDEAVRFMKDDKVNSLTAGMGMGGGNVPCIHSFALQGSMIGRELKNGPQGSGVNDEVSFTLNTTDRHAVAYAMGHDERSASFTPNKADPLTATDYKQPPVVSYQKTVGALCARDYKGVGNQFVSEDKCVIQKAVRKLTPTECERLQGLPDGYTDIEFKGKPAPDSKRYKALGNGMAKPCSDFVIRQICLSAH